MKRLSTFLVFAFLGFTVAKAQSDLLYVSGENDNVSGDAPTLYVSGGEDLYVQGGVNVEGANTRSTGDGLIQVAGTLHIGNYTSVGTGNWTNNTSAPVYAYNNFSVNPLNTYTPGYPSPTYLGNANAVSLEYGNQLISGGTNSQSSYFYNLSLLDIPAANNMKTVAGADIYIGAITGTGAGDTLGTLDLNAEYLNTQNQTVHIQNPSTATSGSTTAISRVDNGALANTPISFSNDITGGMVIASNVGQAQFNGRLARVVDRTNAIYNFPVGSVVTVPLGYGSGQAYNLFRPASITGNGATYNVFGVALVPDDGFNDAGTTMDQQGTPWHDLAGINHQSYFKINQLAGPATQTNGQQITLYHFFTTNSSANAVPNWSTCGNLPDADFPQTLTVAQYDNNGINASWNDVCHGSSTFNDIASSCGSITVAPNNDFCNNSTTVPSPGLDATTTVAYNVPGGYYGVGNNPQEDYAVAGLFFTVDAGNGSCDGNCAALPLNIISLIGWNVPNQNENELQWVTATEENVDNFIVEKSTDGENFTPIGQVESHHFSSTQNTYTYLDNQPNMGNNYYQIREAFNVGPSDLTNVINVPLNKKITIANIYPNPTTDNLNVAFETSEAGTVHIQIYDVLGRLVISGDNAVNEGNNTIVVNTSVLTAGSYFIRLIDAQSNFTDTQKFIKITQ